MKKIYITTPIYYPNAKPHLGHAYTNVVADFLTRLYRLFGMPAFFLTGTDEHGEKLEKKAAELGKSPKELVDEMSGQFREAWKKLAINYDRFIRTTDPDHEQVVRQILTKLWEKGEIYRGTYRGLYCVGCERYYKPSDLIDGKCPYHLKPVEEKRIPAYFFRLSNYRERLLQFYRENPDFIPAGRREEILNRVRELEDLCISRPKEQLRWGIELPFDREHVAYVWVDALMNYVSGAGYGTEKFDRIWPPDIQLMGKDIIWFHCVIWPALLMALDLKMPRRMVAHGFITVDGKKMSKSLGNVIDPLELADQFGTDFLRYLLLKLPFGEDGNIDKKGLPLIYDELANDVGNTVNRVLRLVSTVEAGKFEVDEELRKKADGLVARLRRLLENLRVEEIVRLYSTEVMDLIRGINAYLNEREPWKKEGEEKRNIILNAYETLLIAMALLSPVLVNGYAKFEKAVGRAELGRFGTNVRKPRMNRLILYPKRNV